MFKWNPFTHRLDFVGSGGGGGGDVSGPGSSTNNALVRWDGSTGTIIKNSMMLLSDTGQLLGLAGTSSAPTYSFGGTSNCGMFSDGTNTYLTGSGFATLSVGFNVSISGGITSITQGLCLTNSSAKSADFLCAYGDLEYRIDTSSNQITATLMNSPIQGQILIFKDDTGNAPSNPITINGIPSGVDIDGGSDLVINTAFGCYVLYFNGTQWNVISQVGGLSNNPYWAIDGSAASPAYSFAGDTATGMYLGASILGFSVGGIGFLTINNSGLASFGGSITCANNTETATQSYGVSTSATDIVDFGSATIYGFTDVSAPRTMTLSQSRAAGSFVWIQDQSGQCSPTNTITVSVAGGVKLINGASSLVINSAYGGAKVYYDGTNYYGQVY